MTDVEDGSNPMHTPTSVQKSRVHRPPQSVTWCGGKRKRYRGRVPEGRRPPGDNGRWLAGSLALCGCGLLLAAASAYGAWWRKDEQIALIFAVVGTIGFAFAGLESLSFLPQGIAARAVYVERPKRCDLPGAQFLAKRHGLARVSALVAILGGVYVQGTFLDELHRPANAGELTGWVWLGIVACVAWLTVVEVAARHVWHDDISPKWVSRSPFCSPPLRTPEDGEEEEKGGGGGE